MSFPAATQSQAYQRAAGRYGSDAANTASPEMTGISLTTRFICEFGTPDAPGWDSWIQHRFGAEG